MRPYRFCLYLPPTSVSTASIISSTVESLNTVSSGSKVTPTGALSATVAKALSVSVPLFALSFILFWSARDSASNSAIDVGSFNAPRYLVYASRPALRSSWTTTSCLATSWTGLLSSLLATVSLAVVCLRTSTSAGPCSGTASVFSSALGAGLVLATGFFSWGFAFTGAGFLTLSFFLPPVGVGVPSGSLGSRISGSR